ncbi:MAG: protein tyrosine phosphatase family protein [Proteobacteria bacterium]|nr:protein tyrosine phosphatase family protein [Pseudomonadota bacterium]
MLHRGIILSALLALYLTSVATAEESMRIHVDINAVTRSDDLRPVDGLTSAGQPNEQQFELLAEAGYQAVVDLRGESEDRGLDEAAVLEKLGLDYIVLPLSSPDTISMENARYLDEILSDYEGPVLVHCGSGNRVGALLALRESLRGASDEDALAYGKSAGMTGLEPVVRTRLTED